MEDTRGASVILSFGLVLSLIVGSLATGGVTTPTPEIQVKEGESTDLRCVYPSSLTNPRVEWKFVSNDQTSFVFYDGALTAPYKDRAVAYTQGIQLKSITRKDNGDYVCEVTATDANGSPTLGEAKIKLIVLVAPGVPIAQVPTSVTTGSVAQLSCLENNGSPPPTFIWYKNKTPMPENPKTSPAFQNSSYTLNSKTGVLKFDPVQKTDAGEYYCEAGNSQGKEVSAAVTMSVGDVNIGGIVAAVIIVLLILILIAVGMWFAYSRGYFGKKTK
ncbi:junctional adhesion molecule A-like [Discoglossus pictus]